MLSVSYNKKDGYRQRNVHQRQKLISIIDYDVCMLEYLQPFWRFSTSKNGEESMTIYSAVLIGCQRVTDGQTDRQTDGRPAYIYYVLQHS